MDLDLYLLGSDLTDESELDSPLFDIATLEILFQLKMVFDGEHIEFDELKLYREMQC